MGENRTAVDQYQLRFPAGLRNRVKASASANGRSMNTEIITLIERGLSESPLNTVDNSTVELIAQRTVQLLLNEQRKSRITDDEMDQVVALMRRHEESANGG